MGFPPQGYGAKPSEIWEYTTRRLTNLSDARAAYIDLIPLINPAYIDLIPLVEHETEWATDPHCDSITSLADTPLTVGTITPIFPAGSTRVRAILVASIHALNVAGNAHLIEFEVEGNQDAGAYVNLLDLTLTPQLGLVEVIGTSESWSGAIDVTDLVDTSGSVYNFRFRVDSDNAGLVRYITSFALVLVYNM